MQRLQTIQASSASHIQAGEHVVALKVQFDFQSDEGAYPDAMFSIFKRGDTPEQVVAELKNMIRALETKLSKR